MKSHIDPVIAILGYFGERQCDQFTGNYPSNIGAGCKQVRTPGADMTVLAWDYLEPWIVYP